MRCRGATPLRRALQLRGCATDALLPADAAAARGRQLTPAETTGWIVKEGLRLGSDDEGGRSLLPHCTSIHVTGRYQCGRLDEYEAKSLVHSLGPPPEGPPEWQLHHRWGANWMDVVSGRTRIRAFLTSPLLPRRQTSLRRPLGLHHVGDRCAEPLPDPTLGSENRGNEEVIPLCVRIDAHSGFVIEVTAALQDLVLVPKSLLVWRPGHPLPADPLAPEPEHVGVQRSLKFQGPRLQDTDLAWALVGGAGFAWDPHHNVDEARAAWLAEAAASRDADSQQYEEEVREMDGEAVGEEEREAEERAAARKRVIDDIAAKLRRAAESTAGPGDTLIDRSMLPIRTEDLPSPLHLSPGRGGAAALQTPTSRWARYGHLSPGVALQYDAQETLLEFLTDGCGLRSDLCVFMGAAVSYVGRLESLRWRHRLMASFAASRPPS
eukprot:TRINITY_DN31050_c0_g1_i1.p1 TRINITY_DN31050_c0_g1~~TRINITY_DN31050_c0_g1_i1.p1  ORF type:complete len:450 (+),score=100.95 TRINITY_DN31050_c0_g1_i1:44-1351(+)